MNPIIVIDLDGALFKHRPFDEAHKKWFKLFSVLLEDDSINDWAFKENYFEGIHQVMKRYLGSADKEAQTVFARQVFSMVLVAEVQKSDLIEEFAEYLRSIKDRYTLALVTSAPEGSIDFVLKKVHCEDLFHIIYSSLDKNYPNKQSLMNDFIEKYERPLYYIGEGDKDLGAMKDLDITAISVNWVSKARFKGEHNIQEVDELKQFF
jgi:phosphoglycolate phosphatase-like HAD superfamily hydrolase